MRISETCIRRPVFATVLSLVLTLLGLVAYQRLSIREYPNIDTAVVTVDTKYHGHVVLVHASEEFALARSCHLGQPQRKFAQY